MVVRRADFFKLTEEGQRQLDLVDNYITTLLYEYSEKERERTNSVNIWFHAVLKATQVNLKECHLVREELKKKYENEGWTVELRTGNCMELS